MKGIKRIKNIYKVVKEQQSIKNYVKRSGDLKPSINKHFVMLKSPLEVKVGVISCEVSD